MTVFEASNVVRIGWSIILRRLTPALAMVCLGTLARAEPSPSSSPTPSAGPPVRPNQAASYKERLAAAESVKVETSILGLHLHDSLAKAYQLLDPLTDPAHPATKAAEDGESEGKEEKLLWELRKSDFKSVTVKADEHDGITSLEGFLRPGKEIPFEKIGETKKAPILTNSAVAWDVVRPGQDLIRVVARGEDRKASSISMFVVKRVRR